MALFDAAWWDILLGRTPAKKGLVPTFREVFLYGPNDKGEIVKFPLNKYYFATIETANSIKDRFAPGRTIVAINFGGNGGPNVATEPEYHIQYPGQTINAGILASYFDLNPEDKYPNVAENAVKAVLKDRGVA